LLGTGLYAYKSSICKAGLQQNIISNSDGGLVSVVIGYPQLKLTAGINSENISSDSWPDPSQSQPNAQLTFAVVKSNSC